MATNYLYPLSAKEELVRLYVGKDLKDVPTPAAVLDLRKLKNNCNRMLEACTSLDCGWRAHIKTHKTTELTRLQVGSTGSINLVVSTIVEAENILPLLLEYKGQGRHVNLLYSFPLVSCSTSSNNRLSALAKDLGPHGLSLMVDHPAQLSAVKFIRESSGVAPDIFLKIDMGGHRAGVEPRSESCSLLISQLLEIDSKGEAYFLGLYSHAGHSYASDSRAAALDFLRQEFEALLVTAEAVHSTSPGRELVLSVGATPTTTSIRNLLIDNEDTPPEEAKAIAALRATIQAIRDVNCKLEIHAGVYPTLDMQQLSTHALPTEGPHAMLTWDDLALTILADVASFYPGRGKNGSPEALIGAGGIALGREPCKAYEGWGVVSPWNRKGVDGKSMGMPSQSPEKFQGWIVGRVSQEHGILTWKGEWDQNAVLRGGEGEKGTGEEEGLPVGLKVRVWPNHACIAGVGFGWYFVVDSSREGKEDEIVDVWPRWRGW